MSSRDFDQQAEELVFEILNAEDPSAAEAQTLVEHPHLAERLSRILSRLRKDGWIEGADPKPGETIGPFRIERILGAGGMGVVYLVRDDQLDRLVALKVVRPEMLLQPASRERFRREVESVARLQHRAIAPVYSVDQDADPPYFTMEFVDGPNLAQVIAEARVADGDSGRVDSTVVPRDESTQDPHEDWTESCARIAAEVADALAHAHARGILHRDVKPSNILLGKDGRPRLVDFGLAAVEGSQDLTRTRTELGSLPYTAPEVIRGERPVPSPALDVYSLGVTLYEMLSLRNPMLGDSDHDTRRRILTGTVPSLRTANRRVSWELETVCLVAMDRDPGRRYARAEDFAADLRRCLRREPIAARRPSRWLAAMRFAQRHPTWTVGLLVGLVLLTASSVFVAMSERRSNQEAVRLTGEARRASYASLVQSAAFYLRERPDIEQARELLLRAPVEHRGWEWRHLWSRIEHQSLGSAALSKGVGEFVWDEASALAVLLDGDRDVLVIVDTNRGETQRIEVEKMKALACVPGGDSVVLVTTDGQIIERSTPVGGERFAQVRVIRDNATTEGRAAEGAESTELACEIATLGSDRLVVAMVGGAVEVLNRATGQTVHRMEAHQGLVRTMAVDQESERIVTGGIDGAVCVADARTGTQLQRHAVDPGSLGVHHVAIAPGGEFVVATWGTETRLTVWREDEPRMDYGNGFNFCNIRRDGALAAVWRFGFVRWYATRARVPGPDRQFLGPRGQLAGMVMPADGKAVITVSEHGELSRYDLAAPRSWERLGPTTPRAILSVCWDEAGSSAWAGDYGGNVVRSDLTTRGAQLALTEGEATAHTDRVTVLEQSPDGTLLLTGSLDGSWALWNASTRALIRRVDVGAGVTSGCWLPQGAHCLLGTADGRVLLAPVDASKPTRTFDELHVHYVTRVAMDPNGEWFISVSSRDLVCSALDGTERWRVDRAHEGWVSAVAVDPTGLRVASAGADSRVRLFDSATGAPVHELIGHRRCPSALAFVDGGERLLSSGGYDREIRIWSVATGDFLVSLTPPTAVFDLAVSGDQVVGGTMDKYLECWRVDELALARVEASEPLPLRIDPRTPPPWNKIRLPTKTERRGPIDAMHRSK